MIIKTVIPGYEAYIHNIFRPSTQFNDQMTYRFENNYGASIVFHQGTYGYEDGLVELAVIEWKKDGSTYEISYSTEITNDVIGYLDVESAKSLLEKIKNIKRFKK